MNTHPISTCPTCGARRVSAASACWQCGVVFATLPTTPRAPRRWLKAPWAGVIPLGLFFLPWAIIGRYGVHRVISVSGLELALGRSLRGRLVPHEPLLWLIPCVSLLLAALLLLAYRRTPGPGHWLLIASTAGGGFLLLLIKAVQWLWVEPSSEVIWVVHWLTTWFLLTGSAFCVSALTAMRTWMDARGPRSLSSSSASEDTPVDEEQIR
jgi:hypothetical protein